MIVIIVFERYPASVHSCWPASTARHVFLTRMRDSLSDHAIVVCIIPAKIWHSPSQSRQAACNIDLPKPP